MKKKRCKKWLGSIVGSAINLGGSLYSANKQAELQEEMIAEQRKNESLNFALQNATNLTNKYSDTSYVDDMKKRISFKNGGSIYADRINKIKRFKCGGKYRKK